MPFWLWNARVIDSAMTAAAMMVGPSAPPPALVATAAPFCVTAPVAGARVAAVPAPPSTSAMVRIDAAPAAPRAPQAAFAALRPAPAPAGNGLVMIAAPIELRREADGLFYLNASVNGARVRFLVDTGANLVVLTRADAQRAGVLPDGTAFDANAETAGGATRMARVKLDRVEAGTQRDRGIDAAVVQDGLGVSLLGQSWLSRFASVTIRGDRMLLN